MQSDKSQADPTRAHRVQRAQPWVIGGERHVAFRLRSSAGLEVSVLSFGATLTGVQIPSAKGPVALIRAPTLAAMRVGNPFYLGSTIGRFANRIAGACFVLDEQTVQLEANEAANQLHGGPQGLHQAAWNATVEPGEESAAVRFSYLSPAGESGFPGALACSARYRLADRVLAVTLSAQAIDQATVVSLTSHPYWTLAPEAPLDAHHLTLALGERLVLRPDGCPTGERLAVDDGPYDFRQSRRLSSAENKPLMLDECYVGALSPSSSQTLKPLATLAHSESGRSLRLFSNQPALQVYSGDGLDGSAAAGGHGPRAGLCLEPQQYPDAPNQPDFPSTRIECGETYVHHTEYHFDWPEFS